MTAFVNAQSFCRMKKISSAIAKEPREAPF